MDGFGLKKKKQCMNFDWILERKEKNSNERVLENIETI